MIQDTARQLDDVTRRDFVQRAAQACLGVGLLPAAGLAPALAAPARVTGGGFGRAEHVIYLYMAGGMSHLDTFDPKPESESQGPTEVIKTNADGVQVSEHFAKMAGHMDKVSLVRSLSSTQGAHERGNYFMHTSYTALATIRHPAMGAWALKLGERKNKTLPGNVLIGGGSAHPAAGFLPSRFAPLPIGDPSAGLQHSARPAGVTESQFQRRLRLSQSFDQQFTGRFPHRQVKAYGDLYAQAIRLMKSDDLKAFDLSKENATTKAAYGEDRFAQGVLLARRLVEAGVRFVEVNYNGWDTHNDNFERLPERAVVLDQALAALLSDLKGRGLLDKTLVVVATEFGRTPKINDRQGRDHHPRAFTCVMAGGGVKGGYVHGASDASGFAVAESGVKIPDFNATIAHAMGLPAEEVVNSPSGRPFTVAHKGEPILDLF
ncbi:MAG: DUF1501 domain-containing protein [Phycisphaerae bacterium]|nr:DUF1501 domain-containing protein [Phycisphaerae bacterium]